MQTMTYFLLTKFEQPLQILLWALIAFVLVKTWVASLSGRSYAQRGESSSRARASCCSTS
jgi:hypothetical protein